MKKEIIASAIILFVIASVSFVIAVGSSSGGTPNCQIGSPGCPDTNGVQVNEVYRMCESKITVAERIKCRFNNKEILNQGRDYLPEAVEEACRGHARAEECKQLYRQSKECYEIDSAREKKRCFLEKSGVNINAGGTFRAAPDDSKRNYVVLLLYELQERIENMETVGTITSDEATDLVTQIVEIKKLIIEGKPRSEIIPKIQEFKQAYRTIVGGTAQ